MSLKFPACTLSPVVLFGQAARFRRPQDYWGWLTALPIIMRASNLLIHSRKICHVRQRATVKSANCLGIPGFSSYEGHVLRPQQNAQAISYEMNFSSYRGLMPREYASCCSSMMMEGVTLKWPKIHDTSSCLRPYSGRGYSTSSGLPAHEEIGMPSLSPTMTEGNIARWLKKEGDKVLPGEVLCEVETDKATVEMESMEEGYIAKIIHGDGATAIKVGEVIAVTVEAEDDILKFKDYEPGGAGDKNSLSGSEIPKANEKQTGANAELEKIPEKTAEPSPTEDRVFMSPAARKMAVEHKVPFSSLKGTGPDGRVVIADVEAYLARDVSAVAASPSVSFSDIPVSQIRKVTASRLLHSKQTIPHYYLAVDTFIDNMIDLRSQLNAQQEASGGKRISINDFVIKAAALALRKVPQCNSSWMNEFIRQYNNVNISVAVQTAHGLFVPVIRDADKKGLSIIANEVQHLAQKAKENSLKPADYEGGTFTVSNLGGPFGIKQFCAVINPPQSAILAVGSAEKRVIAGHGSGQFDFATFMPITLSCDHRVVDGAIGAEYLKAFKGYIENPQTMLL